mmetsp:Transcript_18860/g.66646  ORF Transcript_18860/g.66646 Transcript_18860/m.66646 type:complete len:493 (-) Transcript_18860:147-1625(-)|eukprot:CAMPEP_0203806586 /NCGR_PEP_ID=MMETSP0115-20131106/567_1 /ASSEMBLY_ACC=CAM_ASM_000227 /TAXON_ID=33651 /ORGANISM="Bicosoecid sp, Strain ms1" /LENGTH=492 /DNA_ID=CAMNT_0050715247 /DNA_START=169 /DNA_END=1647 /DNA_ORIENTATION=+
MASRGGSRGSRDASAETPLIDPTGADTEAGRSGSVNTAGAGKKVDAAAKAEEASRSRALIISFLAMVLVGLGNKVFQVLEVIPMYNYPLFVNLFTTLIYIPVSWAYITPMIKYGTLITPEALAVPKKTFAVMGLLDSVAGIMQTLSVTFIQNGTLVILLSQSAIPLSMIITKIFMPVKYKISQYVGALVVIGGLIVVLLPTFQHPDSKGGNNVILWGAVMVLSCVPMCLSSVYKEKALGETEIDAVYLNGWVAFFQFLASFPLLIPSAPASNVAFKDLPQNLWDGARCLAGINTITAAGNSTEVARMTANMMSPSVHIDDCSMGPTFVAVYLAFNVSYNVLIILILKYGSSNLLWLAMTIMVPMSSVAFTFKFMPNSKPLAPTDIAGLLIILGGLIIYRFFSPLRRLIGRRMRSVRDTEPDDLEAVESMMATPTRGTTIHTTRKAHARKHSKEFTEEQYRLIYSTPELQPGRGRPQASTPDGMAAPHRRSDA